MPETTGTVRLTPDARRASLPVLPGQPEGTSYGTVSSGIAMPKDGLCYVVRFAEPSVVEILAYVDEYGRIFETSEPERIPPARFPILTMLNYSDVDNTGCLNLIGADGTGRRIAEVRRDLAGYSFINSRIRMPDLPKTDLRGACGIAYLAFRHFPLVNGTETMVPTIPDILKTLRDHPPLDAFRIISEQSRAAHQATGAITLALADYLAAQLDGTGLTDPDAEILGQGEDAYPASAIRLVKLASYSEAFYLDFDRNTAGPRACRALLDAESALNRFVELCRWAEEQGSTETLSPEQCSEADRWLCDCVCKQAPDPAAAPVGSGEWDARMALSRSIERLRLPFRIDCDFRMNLEEDAIAMDVLCPGIAFMPRVELTSAGPAGRSEEALRSDEARYAAHAAILYLACGFASSAAVKTALVNVLRIEPESDRECIISVECARDAFEQSFSADGEHLFADPFAVLAKLGASLRFSPGFKLEPVKALGSIHDELYCPPKRFCDVDENDGAFDAEAAEMLGVARVSDLNIFEDRQRNGLSDRILAALEHGRDQGLEAVKDIHDRTENIPVRAVCDRIAEGIGNGDIDAGSYLEIREAFADLYGLRELQMRASNLIEHDAGAAQSLFERIAAMAEAGRWFEDTPLTCYRFFDSYPARVLMAKTAPDEKRRILPISDDIFFAHDRLAYLLCDSFDAGTEGLAHAEAAMAMAPTQTSSHAHAARIYYFLGDFASEIKECKAMLSLAFKKTELALAYYWLGYAYWKTGKPEVGAACYRRSVELDQEYASAALSELESLTDECKGARAANREDDDRLLEEEGIPHTAARENAEFLLRAAKAAADAGSFTLSQILLASAIPHLRDDALYPVFRSMEP